MQGLQHVNCCPWSPGLSDPVVARRPSAHHAKSDQRRLGRFNPNQRHELPLRATSRQLQGEVIGRAHLQHPHPAAQRRRASLQLHVKGDRTQRTDNNALCGTLHEASRENLHLGELSVQNQEDDNVHW